MQVENKINYEKWRINSRRVSCPGVPWQRPTYHYRCAWATKTKKHTNKKLIKEIVDRSFEKEDPLSKEEGKTLKSKAIERKIPGHGRLCECNIEHYPLHKAFRR